MSTSALHRPLASPTFSSPQHLTSTTMLRTAPEHNAMVSSREMSASERERAKTKLEKGLDWSYTANHALYCLVTDAPDIVIRTAVLSSDGLKNKVQRFGQMLADKVPYFENNMFLEALEDHDLTEFKSNNRVHQFFNQNSATVLLREVISEIIGDAIAVPFSVALQRKAPSLMNKLRSFGEWAQGGLFKKSTQRVANKWAIENGYDADSPVVKAKQKELYEYEVDHLPLAYTWTISSMFFNSAVSKTFSNKSFSSHLWANVLGVSTTFLGVTALRTIFPEKAANVDDWTKRKIFDNFKSDDRLAEEMTLKQLKEKEILNAGKAIEHNKVEGDVGVKLVPRSVAPEPFVETNWQSREAVARTEKENVVAQFQQGF